MLSVLIKISIVIFLEGLYLFSLSKLKKYFSRKEIGTLKKLYKILSGIVVLYLLVIILVSVLGCIFFNFANLSTYDFWAFGIFSNVFMIFIFSQFAFMFGKVYGTAKKIEKEKDIIRKIDELISYLIQNGIIVLNINFDNKTTSSDFLSKKRKDLFTTCLWSLKLLDKVQKQVLLVLNDSYGGTLYSKEFTLTKESYNELLNYFYYSIE